MRSFDYKFLILGIVKSMVVQGIQPIKNIQLRIEVSSEYRKEA